MAASASRNDGALHRLFPATLASLAVLSATLVVSAWGDCPTNTVSCMDDNGTTVSTTTTEATAGCHEHRTGAGYDLGLGSFSATGVGGPGGTINFTGNAIASDTYVIVGLPVGTPLAFQVAFTVQASAHDDIGCVDFGTAEGASASASLHDLTAGTSDGVSVSTSSVCGFPGICCYSSSDVNRTLLFAVTHAAGESFTLRYEMYASAYGHGFGNVSAQIGFVGLPDGAQVISCQGYHGPVTPTRNFTWGALKTRYR